MNIKELKQNLEKRKNQLFYTLCEDESIFHPNVIHQLVMELRAVIKLLKEFE